MKRRLKNPHGYKTDTTSPEWHQRQRVWRHNSAVGMSVHMRGQLNFIIGLDTATPETKHIASSILGLVTKLQNSLANRKD